MLQKNAPVAVFDSGHGGVSVLRELVRLLPREDFLYFGDSANAPYGPRTTAEVRRLTFENAQMLFGRGCKALVVACNSATSAAISLLRQRYPDRPVIGIEPALKPAVQDFPDGEILVLATAMTLREKKFVTKLEASRIHARIHPVAAPGIVECVERGVVDGPELEAYLWELLAPWRTAPIDAVVLGCTHFPFVRRVIRRCLARPAAIYDGGPGTARQTARRLAAAGLLAERAAGTVELCNSAGAEALSRRLLELPELD